MEIQAWLAGLLAGAQRAGAVRPELGLPEFIALLAGTGRAMEQLGADPAPRERIFEVVFDGLRPARFCRHKPCISPRARHEGRYLAGSPFRRPANCQ